LLNYSDVGLSIISFPARCVSDRATGLGACPIGPPVESCPRRLPPCGPVPFAVTAENYQEMNINGPSVGASSRWCEQKCEKYVSRVKDYGVEL